MERSNKQIMFPSPIQYKTHILRQMMINSSQVQGIDPKIDIQKTGSVILVIYVKVFLVLCYMLNVNKRAKLCDDLSLILRQKVSLHHALLAGTLTLATKKAAWLMAKLLCVIHKKKRDIWSGLNHQRYRSSS